MNPVEVEPPVSCPVLPLRNQVVFPFMAIPLSVGRPRSISALEAAMQRQGQILLAMQLSADCQNPLKEDLHEVGVLATVLHLFTLRNGSVKALVSGQTRVRITNVLSELPHLEAEFLVLPDTPDPAFAAETPARVAHAREVFETFIHLSRLLSPEFTVALSQIEDPGQLSDVMIGQIAQRMDAAQLWPLLEITDPLLRLEQVVFLLEARNVDLGAGPTTGQAPSGPPLPARDPELSRRPQALPPAERPAEDEFAEELRELEEQVFSKPLTAEARERCARELRKLRMMAPMSAEASVVRNYLDWILQLPWDETTPDELDIERSQRILDEDHFGMEEPKQRILEHLAVQILAEKIHGPILCFTGPPGVGKTSLAASVARACGRRFVRISLGGVRDEAEIRGHRRTYVGAMPGKIIQGMKKAGSVNPVILLDEIDKMTADFRGDPAAALLEVLDPHQNATFCDHYLDIDYDLSRVLFIATSNQLDTIPWALRDRMEIIELDGYTEWEKLAIARRHLVPGQIAAHGLRDRDVHFSEPALRDLVNLYSRETGVRQLERLIATVCRRFALDHVKGSRRRHWVLSRSNLGKWVGKPRFDFQKTEELDQVGVVQGLAVTPFGGDLLMAEAQILPGKGRLQLTGKLGEVLQESAQAALSYIRSRASSWGLAADLFDQVDIHVHFPGGAIPKDGPSAGITMACAIVSCLLKFPVRAQVAMTGEITLRGKVMKIGGLKAKLIAAHRSGVRCVCIPQDNTPDLDSIPESIRRDLRIVPVSHIDQVLACALCVPGDFTSFNQLTP
ncbi:MAG: endopeptidase La [Deltaproteobacteria bacterium HGW-Deltaproteobacteria-17]|nr:MAG: endopeptidase La [Deltaproteobacteria bacterium HGW-Deltaproteobacteria-17]